MTIFVLTVLYFLEKIFGRVVVVNDMFYQDSFDKICTLQVSCLIGDETENVCVFAIRGTVFFLLGFSMYATT